MDSAKIRIRVGNEISTLASELANRWDKVDMDPESKRHRYLSAQVAICEFIGSTMLERTDNWDWVEPVLRRYLDVTLLEYREAREAGNYESALVRLGRIRFLQMASRRIADTRRMQLFANERKECLSDYRDLVARELQCFLGEYNGTIQRLEAEAGGDNDIRQLMALAPVYLIRDISKKLRTLEDVKTFDESLTDYIETETERYCEARASGDRRSAWAMLARLRFTKTLIRRLANPQRREWLALLETAPPTRH
ncbi:hypothetical protein GMST_04790 [Geomonas silvestris]|uniref:Uncharacterized protein n=1 Tax=Geomonas silvestris TaxID=2740184 RepID=A0A6V8ME56_9BACT|nr:hypothetical protein [Geomonas silvestris]GFO58154.1 hypothetical protein GMST_04790 [Geomonas silvestris]